MAWHLALVIEPAVSDDSRTDFSATFLAVDPSSPVLPLGELSAQRGDGVFESLGVVGSHPQEVDAHLRRLARSAELCDLPAPHAEQWRQAIERVARGCGPGESVIKLILSRGIEHGAGPTAWVTAAPAADFTAARQEGIRIATLDRGYDSGAPLRAPWLLQSAKTLSYAVNMAAIREAKRRGADDALFVTSDGVVLEAPTASLIARIDGVFVTPTPAGGILPGTTQASIFSWLRSEGGSTASREVTAADLGRADAAWLVSSVRLAAPIREIDGVRLPVDLDLTPRLNDYLLSPRD